MTSAEERQKVEIVEQASTALAEILVAAIEEKYSKRRKGNYKQKKTDHEKETRKATE